MRQAGRGARLSCFLVLYRPAAARSGASIQEAIQGDQDMHCQHCNKEIALSDTYCSACGKPIKISDPIKSEKSQRRRFLWLLVPAVFLLNAFIATWLNSKQPLSSVISYLASNPSAFQVLLQEA